MSASQNTPTLFDVGREILTYFRLLGIIPKRGVKHIDPESLLLNKIALEQQRFQLWAGNLGVHQHGHASLDYRLRDADVVRFHVLGLLEGMKEYLSALLEILSGERLPYEDALTQARIQGSDDSRSYREDGESSEAGSIETDRSDSGESETSNLDTVDAIDEASVRYQGIVERIDSLYSIATKIRNPSTKPTRSTAELYKHYPTDDVVEYMQERIEIETQVVKYILGQHLMQFEISEFEGRFSPDSSINRGGELSATGARETSDKLLDSDRESITQAFDPREAMIAEADWLLKRIGKANARRRQQFVYWKEHAHLIANPKLDSVEEEDIPIDPRFAQTARQLPASTRDLPVGGSQIYSNPTSATRLDPQAVRLDDAKSVISRSSRASTMIGTHKEILSWPSPPTNNGQDRFFVCEYCMLLCPPYYLEREKWTNHVIHDLQPYQCTYPDCEQPDRLFSSRHEWMNHEGLSHTRIWSCAAHLSQEFETQPEYIAHLVRMHPREPELHSPELVAACMQPSAVPHRGCPLCPIDFESVKEMQGHIGHHLERFGLLVLPKQDELNDENDEDGQGSVLTADAAVRRARDEDSRAGDFEGLNLIFEDNDPEEKGFQERRELHLSQDSLEGLQTLEPQIINDRPTISAWIEMAATQEPGLVTMPQTQSYPDALMPQRVLDIAKDRIHLVDDADKLTERKYAVLDFSIPQIVATNIANLASRRSSILDHGSLTVWRAIRVCRTLEIPYLWVRELCVIEDSLNDQRRFRDSEDLIQYYATKIWRSDEELPEDGDTDLQAEAASYFGRTMAENQ